MSKSASYKLELMNKASKRTKDMAQRDVRCNVCGHKLLVAYEDYDTGHIKSYCNKCHEYRIINCEDSSDERPPRRTEDRFERDIRCPVCNHMLLIAYMDSYQGHVQSYCNKCHEYRVIDFKSFRSGEKE